MNGKTGGKPRQWRVWTSVLICSFLLFPAVAWSQVPAWVKEESARLRKERTSFDGFVSRYPCRSVEKNFSVNGGFVDPRNTRNTAHGVILALQAARIAAYEELVTRLYRTTVITKGKKRPGRDSKDFATKTKGRLSRAFVKQEKILFDSKTGKVPQGAEAAVVSLCTLDRSRDLVVRGFGIIAPGDFGKDAERKARLQGILMALSRLGEALGQTEVRSTMEVSKTTVLKAHRISASTEFLLGKIPGAFYSLQQSAQVRELALFRQRSEHRFWGNSWRMGLRELRFLRLGGKVKAAELVIVESILKKLGIEVGKGGKPVAFQDGSKLLPVTLRMKGNALRVLLPPPPPPEKYRPRRPSVPPVPPAAKGPSPPKVAATTVPPYKAVPGAPTGLIVDASGLGLQPTLVVRILTSSDKKIVYGPHSVPRQSAMDYSLAGYAASLSEAKERFKDHVGPHPLIVKAVGVAGVRSENPLVSDKDARRIIEADAKGKFLRAARVVIVYR